MEGTITVTSKVRVKGTGVTNKAETAVAAVEDVARKSFMFVATKID